MSASSEDDYHSAEEARGERGSVDTAQLSRDLEGATLSEEDESDGRVHVAKGVGEKEKTPELTEEEIQVYRGLLLTVTLCYCSVSCVCVRGRSEK